MTTPVQYLDLTETPSEVLDVMTPTYTRADLEPVTHRVTHVDARQIHLTVHQHITVAAPPNPVPEPPQLEAPGPEPTPVASMPPRRTGVDLGDVTAVFAALVVVALLLGVLVFIDLLVWAMAGALAGIAIAATVAFLLSLGGGKCAGILVHCGGCKG